MDDQGVETRYGFIDATGKVVIPINLEDADEFSEGLAHVWVDHRPAFIDTAGKVQFFLPQDCVNVGSFREGLALVNAGGDSQHHSIEGGLWGYVDRDGRFAIPPRFTLTRGLAYDWSTSPVSSFSEGLAAVPGPDGRFGFIDRTGRWVIPPQFDHVEEEFWHGLAKVEMNKNSKDNYYWGYVDRTGRFVWQSKPGPP
jgi:hypothetical protein